MSDTRALATRKGAVPALIAGAGARVGAVAKLRLTDLLNQNMPLEDAQYLARHSSPTTTRVYDRRRRKVTQNIVERISI